MSRTYRRRQALHLAAEWPCTSFDPATAHQAEEIRRRARFHGDGGGRLLHYRYESTEFPKLTPGAERVQVRARLRGHRLPEGNDTPLLPPPRRRYRAWDYA